jgi:hypothetical protein
VARDEMPSFRVQLGDPRLDVPPRAALALQLDAVRQEQGGDRAWLPLFARLLSSSLAFACFAALPGRYMVAAR